MSSSNFIFQRGLALLDTRGIDKKRDLIEKTQ